MKYIAATESEMERVEFESIEEELEYYKRETKFWFEENIKSLEHLAIVSNQVKALGLTPNA